MKNNILIIAILLLISNFFYDYSKQEVKVMEREKIVKFIKSEIINNFDSNNFEISSLEIEKTFPLNKIIFSMDILNKERLKKCRLKLGITKQEAAKRIQISQPAYLRYEAGSRNPSIQIISKMAEVFSTSTDYLIGKSADSSPNRLVVEQSDTPALFSLVETCKTLNAAQLMRLTAYAKALSNVTSDSEK